VNKVRSRESEHWKPESFLLGLSLPPVVPLSSLLATLVRLSTNIVDVFKRRGGRQGIGS